VSDVIRGLGIEIDLSGDADSELRDWIKGMKEARGGADSFAGSMTDLEKEMVASAKKIGMSEEHLKDLINETRRAKEVQAFAQNYGFAMNEVQKKTREATSVVSNFRKVIGGILAAGALSKIFGAGKEMVGLASSYEQTTVAFGVMLGNADKAKTVLADLDKFSNVTPFEPKQVNEAAKTLLQFKVQSEDLIPLMQKVGDVAAGTGKDYNQLAAMVGKANALNKVDNEMLQQVPVLYGELAKSMGKSEKQIFEMASAGKIGFKELEGAMASMTSEGGVFFGMMDKQSKTAIGMWSTLMGNVDNVKRSFGQMILEAFKPLLNHLVTFTSWLLKNKAAMAVLKIALLIMVPLIGVVLVGAIISATTAFWGMAAGVLAATWPFVLIGALILGLILIIEDLYQFFTGGESVIGEWASKGWEKIKEFFTWVWDGITSWVSDVIDSIAEFGEMLIDMITWPFREAYKNIKDALGAVWDFLFGDDENKEIKVSGSVQQVAGARAGGGPVYMGKTYLVGEKGPELFTPDRDGYVLPDVPALTTGSTSGSGEKSGGGMVFAPVITINGPSTKEDGEYLANVIRKTLEEFASNIDGGVRAGLGLEVG
jgi:tape measure domain-containing protein